MAPPVSTVDRAPTLSPSRRQRAAIDPADALQIRHSWAADAALVADLSDPLVLGKIPALVEMPKWKRAMDVTLAALGLIVLFPLLIAIAIIIRGTSPGAVIYRQRRHGLGNRVFHAYKFRTMFYNLISHADTWQTCRDDPRITRIGRFLRRTSLDELPQLWNVLEGTMSLVGPRPHPVSLNERYAPLVDNYELRHRVPPGITGWAQVSGLRGAIESVEQMQTRVSHDLDYIKNQSFLLDLKILLWTARVVWMQTNAN